MTKWLARLYMKLAGWKVLGEHPEVKKFVIIAAPHTSNWDLILMLASAKILGLRISWMGKHTLFKPPWGWLMRWLGGLPVDRRAPQGLVGQIADQFKARDELALAIPPEGTRGYVDYWKSGFYYIAKEAQVPIVMSFLDYGKKESGIGPSLIPGDDLIADMDAFRAFYSDKQGKYPKLSGPIRLKNEDSTQNTDSKKDKT